MASLKPILIFLLKLFRLIPSTTNPFRLHWLNKEVPDEMIAYFREEYCDDVKTIKHELDDYGFKSGIQTATIRLFQNQKPSFPHILKLTPTIPMLSGRLPLCLQCHHIGHIRSVCVTPFCRHCHVYGHSAESCQPSYASATREKQTPPQEEKDKNSTDTDSDDMRKSKVYTAPIYPRKFTSH